MAITISGQNNNDRILASDGVLDSISGFNVVGVMTAGTFDVTGKTSTGHLSVGSNIHIGNAGIITATTLVGNVTGNINHTSNLLLQISGSEKFRVGTSGQLGIGGANYGTSGQVLTSGGSGSAASWTTISTSTDKIIEGDTKAEVVDSGSDGHFKVTTDNTERFRIVGGNIGFNRTSVNAGDSATQSSTATPARFVFNNQFSNGYTDNSLKIYLFNDGATRQGFTSGPLYDLQYHSSGSSTHAKHSFFTQNSERLRIHPDYLITAGYNNISSNTQPSRLRVQGSYVNAVGPFGILEFKNRYNSGDAVCSIRGVRDGVSGGNYSAGLTFHTNSSNPASASDGDHERLRITSTGNVGVGDYSSTNLTHAFQALRTSGSTYVSSKNTGGNALFYAEASNGNTAKLELMQAGTGNFTLEVGSTNALMFKDDGTERLRIPSNGGTTFNHTSVGVAYNFNGPSADNNWGGYLKLHSNDGTTVRAEIRASTSGLMFGYAGDTGLWKLTSDKSLTSGNLALNALTDGDDNYTQINSDNHANSLFGLNLRLRRSGGTNGTHEVEQVNSHGSIGAAGMYIGGNGSANNSGIVFYAFGQGNNAGHNFGQNDWRMRIRPTSAGDVMEVRTTQNSGNAGMIIFRDGNLDFCGQITTNGGNNTTSYNTSSDYRLKTKEALITDGITRVKNLKPYQFEWKSDLGTKVDGFFAHEAQTVVPESVVGTKDEVDSDGNPKYQGIDQAKLVPLLTAALQEAIAEIETLKTKVSALEGS